MFRSSSKTAAVLFLSIASVVFAFHANRVVATNDEGIVLDAAQRMLGGAHPYSDFFGYMSPGSYWLQALVFRIFGVALWSGRLIVTADFALQCALLFWLVARLGSIRAAWIGTALFFGFEISDPTFLTAQHRWDSATFALAGVCLTMGASRAWHWIAAGALFAAAAWCTPSMALVGAVTGGFLLVRNRRAVLPLAAGIAGVTTAAAGTLAATGSLGAFVRQVLWLGHNYSALNFMPYGAIIGGYHALFEGASGVGENGLRAVVVACVALPAILPPLGIALGAWGLPRFGADKPWIALLMAVVAALAASTYPRSDIEHLAFIAAVPYALAAIGFSRLVRARAASIVSVALLVFAFAFASNFFRSRENMQAVDSPVGALRVEAAEARTFSVLLSRIHRGQDVFVYPYMPIDYFLTQGHNPTRFSFVNPGMMSREDSLQVLDALRARPPENLLYLKLSEAELLRVFPHGANLDWHYEALENWLETHYEPLNPEVSLWGYRLCRLRRESEPALQVSGKTLVSTVR